MKFFKLALLLIALFLLNLSSLYSQGDPGLKETDYSIAGIAPGDSLDRAKEVFGEQKYESKSNDEISGNIVYHYLVKGLAEYSASNSPEGMLIWSLTILNSEYKTPRGIKVGDKKGLVIEKYGKKYYETTYDMEGKKYLILDYSSMKFYKALVFYINKSTNCVEKIRVALIID